jgi:hypothetical protein
MFSGGQEVAGSNPVFPIFHKSIPNRELRYLTAFVSAVKYLFQSWKFFHEMNWESRTWHEKRTFFRRIFSTNKADRPAFESTDATYLLGPYGSDESRIAYGELVKKLAGGLPIDPLADSKRGSLPRNESDDPGPSVGELCLAFLRHAETHYVKNGKPTSEYDVMKAVIRPLNELYGLFPAKDFGPLALKAVRQKFVDLGWVRVSCNKGVNRIRHIFKYAMWPTN